MYTYICIYIYIYLYIICIYYMHDNGIYVYIYNYICGFIYLPGFPSLANRRRACCTPPATKHPRKNVFAVRTFGRWSFCRVLFWDAELFLDSGGGSSPFFFFFFFLSPPPGLTAFPPPVLAKALACKQGIQCRLLS